MASALPAGWYGDPADSSRYRYWTGDQWTTHVRDRGAVDIAGARPLPDFDGAASTPTEASGSRTGTGRARRRVPVLVAVLALAALVATAGVVGLGDSDSSEASGNTLVGEVRVTADQAKGAGHAGFVGDGTRCGAGAAPGVGVGTEVTVANARGEELGRTVLTAGEVDRTLNSTTCVFRYEIVGVANAEVYSVRVADRAATRLTGAQLAAADWRIDLRVG